LRHRPIRSVIFAGLKIRTPDAPIYVEAWKALGAAPSVANLNKLYETLKMAPPRPRRIPGYPPNS